MSAVSESVSRPLALVTGASSGIGLELARVFKDEGYDLVLCAEDDALESAADELSVDGEVRTIRLDLRRPEAVDNLYESLHASGRPVDVAALNAGVGQGEAFIDNDLADVQSIIDLNITSTVRLMHRLLPDMVERNDGRILVTSSIASTMPGSYQAVYNASKSFVQSFTEAVQDEIRDTEVVITSLMPGPTDTEFFHRADMDDTPIGKSGKDDPARVARQGYDALMSGKRKVVAGSMSTKAQEAVAGVLPDRVKAAAHRKMAEPESE
jgi:short-subunit dehydrogenase